MLTRLLDLFDDAAGGLLRRPGRAALAALGALLGIGAVVATVGLSASARAAVSAEFDRVSVTRIAVSSRADMMGRPDLRLDADDAQRIEAIDGVEAAGFRWDRPLGEQPVRGPRPDAAPERIDVIGIDPGYLAAAETTVRAGRTPEPFEHTRGEQVALLGAAAADRLGVSRFDLGSVVRVGAHPFVVVGIIGDPGRDLDLQAAVVIPQHAVERITGGVGKEARGLVRIRIGAGEVVAPQIPYAVDPVHPSIIEAAPPPAIRLLRDRVETQVDGLLLGVAAVSVVVGAIGIANSMLVSVMERLPEIGMRRALGARRGTIVAQFVGEASLIGGCGGAVGTAVGTLVVVAVAVVKQWTPVLSVAMLAGAPVAGLLVGALGGAYPAWRAARVAPVDALRR